MASVGLWAAQYNCTLSDFRPVELNGGYSPQASSDRVVWNKMDTPFASMFYDAPSNCWIVRRAGSFWSASRCLDERQTVVGLPPQDGWTQLRVEANGGGTTGRVECYEGPLWTGGRWALNATGAIAIAVPFLIFVLTLAMILAVARNSMSGAFSWARWPRVLRSSPREGPNASPMPPSPLPTPIRGRQELNRRRSRTDLAAEALSFLDTYTCGSMQVTRTTGAPKRIPWTTGRETAAGSTNDTFFSPLASASERPRIWAQPAGLSEGAFLGLPPRPPGMRVNVEQRFGSLLLKGERLRLKPPPRPPAPPTQPGSGGGWSKGGARRWSAASMMSGGSDRLGRGDDEESAGVGSADSRRVSGTGFFGGVGRVLGGVFGGSDGGSVCEKEPCCVCLDAAPDVHLLPCKHRVECRACLLKQLVEWKESTAPLCPICRGVIDSVSLDDPNHVTDAEHAEHGGLSRNPIMKAVSESGDGRFTISAELILAGQRSDRDKVVLMGTPRMGLQ